MINIKDYGAIGDGVVDDTQSFTNALTASRANNTSLYIPGGTYKIRTQIRIKPEDTIIGDGSRKSILKYFPLATSDWFVVMDNPSNFTDFVNVSSVSIHGSGQKTLGGLFGSSLRSSNFTDVEFMYFTNTTLQLHGVRNPDGTLAPGDSTYNNFTNCRFFNGVNTVILGGSQGATRIKGGTSNMNIFLNCRFAGGTTTSLSLQQGAANNFTKCSFSGSPNLAIVSWYGNTFQSCVVENYDSTGILFTNNAESKNNYVIATHNGGTGGVTGPVAIRDMTGKNRII